jgi:hypothetical protein
MSSQTIAHILRNKWIYVLTMVACAIISIITYKSITREYSSIAYVFATNSFSPTKVLTEPNAGSQDDPIRYGDKESIEQTLQLFLSNDLKLKLIKKYNLAKYWDVKESEVYKLLEKWDQDININITGLVSIRIEVYNSSQSIANAIASDIIVEANLIKKEINAKTLQVTLNILRERLTDELQAMLNTPVDSSNLEVIFNANRGKLEQLLSKNDLKRTLEIYYKYKDAKVNIRQSLPASFVISKPVENSGEQRPKFLILFALITISTLILEFIIITIIEKLNKNKSNG